MRLLVHFNGLARSVLGFGMGIGMGIGMSWGLGGGAGPGLGGVFNPLGMPSVHRPPFVMYPAPPFSPAVPFQPGFSGFSRHADGGTVVSDGAVVSHVNEGLSILAALLTAPPTPPYRPPEPAAGDPAVSGQIVSGQIVSDQIVSDQIVSDQIVSDSGISDSGVSEPMPPRERPRTPPTSPSML